MVTENLSTLKIHRLTQEQYDRELEAGRIDENALYLTPNEVVDLSKHAISADSATTADSANSINTTQSYTDADRNVWFSDIASIGKMNYSDKLKYNPSKDILTVGSVKSKSLNFDNRYSASLSTAGWYRIFTSSVNDTAGDTVRFTLSHGYNYDATESYSFSVSVGYNGNIDITQLSGAVAGVLNKIRVVHKNGNKFYIDFYYNASRQNTVYVYGSGVGTFQNPSVASIPDGYSSFEFTTAKGCKTNNGFVGNLNGTATQATQDGDGNNIALTYLPKTVTYLGLFDNTKTIADLQSALLTWCNANYKVPNARAYFSTHTNFIELWNNQNLTATLIAGQNWVVEMDSYFTSSGWAMLKITTYNNKGTYYVALRNGSWLNIQTVAFMDDISLSSLNLTATATELNYVDGVTSNIQTQLDNKASVTNYTGIVVSDSDWEYDDDSECYSKTIAVKGMSSIYEPIVDIDFTGALTSGTTRTEMLKSFYRIGLIETGANSITLYCYDSKPTTEFKIKMKVVN